jgi:PEGA domain
MTRNRLTIGAVALGFALSVLPAAAGQRPGGEGGGPGGGGGAGSGSGGGGGGNAGGGSGGGSVSSGGSSSSSSSSGSSDTAVHAPAPSRREAAIERAPQRPNAEQRRGGGGDRPRGGEPSTGRAVPRGTSPSGGESTTLSSGEGRGRDRATSPRDRAIPTYSRPREGRTVAGRSTERFTPPVRPGGDGGYYYSPYPYGYYYDPYGYYGSYWYPGYAFGLGYFYYDPFWYGGYTPYGYQGGYSGGSSGSYSYREAGSLRLKIKPREAQVFVDGYYVGNVDSFDGMFQRLTIDAGGHKLEIRAPGYETLQVDVLITPGETVTFKGEMERVQ